VQKQSPTPTREVLTSMGLSSESPARSEHALNAVFRPEYKCTALPQNQVLP
jgi:hypothetical protein